MKILNVKQGSSEWLAARPLYHCASDAAAMMGDSPYESRSDLVKRIATGIVPEINESTQALFDRGHATEAAARAIVEEKLGEELFPVVATDDAGYLLASFDGINMDGSIGFEHKLWNNALAAQVRANEIPPSHCWQLEQQILVGGLEKIIFVVSDGTLDNFVSTEYVSVPGRAEALMAGWKQFDADVAAYQHVEVLPSVTATPVMQLPALSIQVQGALTLNDNLALFGTKLTAFIAGVPANPSTDQEFADAEAAVKTLEAAEKALEAAKASALAQTTGIEEMTRTVALYAGQARQTRLMLEKLVKTRKETIRIEIMQGGKDALAAHVAGLNKRIGKPYMPVIPADFALAIKGKKSVTSIREAVDSELARAKIEANRIADLIQINLNTLRELAADHAFLFADVAQLVLKAADDFTALVKIRIAEHEGTEAKRIEVEREKIRAEEIVKLEREDLAKKLRAEAELKAEQARVDADRRTIATAADRDVGTVRTDWGTPSPGSPDSAAAPKPRVTLTANGAITPILPTPLTDSATNQSIYALCAQLERDCTTFALYLHGADSDTFAPETREAMDRWRPRVQKIMSGK